MIPGTVVVGWIADRTPTGYACSVYVVRRHGDVWREWVTGRAVDNGRRVYGSALGAEYDAMRVWQCNRPSFRFPRRERCIAHT